MVAVATLVLRELGSLLKAFLAVTASEGLRSGVDSQVVLQVASLVELAHTGAANKHCVQPLCVLIDDLLKKARHTVYNYRNTFSVSLELENAKFGLCFGLLGLGVLPMRHFGLAVGLTVFWASIFK